MNSSSVLIIAALLSILYKIGFLTRDYLRTETQNLTTQITYVTEALFLLSSITLIHNLPLFFAYLATLLITMWKPHKYLKLIPIALLLTQLHILPILTATILLLITSLNTHYKHPNILISNLIISTILFITQI